MNIELLAQIQPYIDEYCEAKKKYGENNMLAEMEMYAAEKAIMQILIDSNCKEITE